MIKREHKQIPSPHIFPDGGQLKYWRDPSTGHIWGQVLSKDGKRGSPKFRYFGDTP